MIDKLTNEERSRMKRLTNEYFKRTHEKESQDDKWFIEITK